MTIVTNLLRTAAMALLMMLACFCASAQELLCTVEVNSDQVNGTYKQVFETLQQAMSEYLNTTVFTNTQIAANEKIECRLFLTVKEYADDVVKGDLQIQSLRPVYNSSYTTTLINFKDTKIEFTYREGEPAGIFRQQYGKPPYGHSQFLCLSCACGRFRLVFAERRRTVFRTAQTDRSDGAVVG